MKKKMKLYKNRITVTYGELKSLCEDCKSNNMGESDLMVIVVNEERK